MGIKKAKKIMEGVFREFYPQLMCSDVCKIFLMIMDSHDIEGRYVALTRPSTDPIQGHSTCEIRLNGKWICFDVAFNHTDGNSAKNIDINKHPAVLKNNSYYDEFKELYSNREYVKYE